jgi:hypothetical protein
MSTLLRYIILLFKYKAGFPFIFGILFTTISGGFLVGNLIAETTIGRPSSTSAIGYIFLPIASLSMGILGFAIAAFISHLIGRYLSRWGNVIDIKSPRVIILFLICLSVGVYLSAHVGYNSGYNNIKHFEELSKPHVIIDSKVISKVANLPPTVLKFQPSVITWDLSMGSETIFHSLIGWITKAQKNTPTVSWNKQMVTVVSSERNVISIRDSMKRIIVETDLSKYDYTREVWAVPICFYLDKPEYLAVFANLRSTSNRAIILVYNSQGTIVYQEGLARKNCDPTIRKVTNLLNSQEYLEVKTHETFYLSASR